MPVSEASSCMSCGATADLSQCSTCGRRLGDKGVKVAICATCIKDSLNVEAVGQLTNDETGVSFKCRPCIITTKRAQEAELMSAVAGPSPTEVLTTVANTAPWFLIIKRASDED